MCYEGLIEIILIYLKFKFSIVGVDMLICVSMFLEEKISNLLFFFQYFLLRHFCDFVFLLQHFFGEWKKMEILELKHFWIVCVEGNSIIYLFCCNKFNKLEK